MSSEDDKQQQFLDSSPSIQKNPEFIGFLTREQENKLKGAKLERMDYLAITIALLQTVFVPIFVLMGIFVVLGLIMSGFLPGLVEDYYAFFDSIFYPIPAILVNIVATIIVIVPAYVLFKFAFGSKKQESEMPSFLD